MSTTTEATTYSLGLIPEDYTAPAFRIPASSVYKSVIAKQMPSQFDTRLADVFPVRDQGQQGTCAAFSAAEVSQNLEYWDEKVHLTKLLAPQYIYNCRPGSDEGMNYSDVQNVLQNDGVVLESDYPYGEQICTRDEVPKNIIEKGCKHEMRQFVHITSIEELKAAMVHHKAGVMMGLKVWNFGKEFFKDCPGDVLQGYHSIVAVAYDDDKREITIQNSWGKDWGDKGFTVMTYDDFNKSPPMATLSFADITGPSFKENETWYSRLMGY